MDGLGLAGLVGQDSLAAADCLQERRRVGHRRADRPGGPDEDHGQDPDGSGVTAAVLAGSGTGVLVSAGAGSVLGGSVLGGSVLGRSVAVGVLEGGTVSVGGGGGVGGGV